MNKRYEEAVNAGRVKDLGLDARNRTAQTTISVRQVRALRMESERLGQTMSTTLYQMVEDRLNELVERHL